MGEANSLKQLFQSLVPDPLGIFQGTVVSASPLKIQAANDEKLIIPALLLIVPKHLTDHTVDADFSIGEGAISAATDTAEAHSHRLTSFSVTGGTITVRNGLKIGEKVHLLSLNNGKKYYVLDRVV